MKTLRDLLCICVLGSLLIPSAALADTLYKSIDPDGKVIYSDRPPTDAKVQKTLTFSNLPASPLPESVIRYRQELQKSVQNRLSSPSLRSSADIQLFTAVWCGFCKKAKAYLAGKNIRYQEYDIDTPDGKLAFAQAGTGSGIPLLLWKGKQMQGFSKAGYDSLFEHSK
jgi:glutaredoxin